MARLARSAERLALPVCPYILHSFDESKVNDLYVAFQPECVVGVNQKIGRH